MTKRLERKRYYWTEMSVENAAAISSACETLGNIFVGKLDIIESIVSTAYKRRTNEDIPEEALDIVRDALKKVQYIGWDTTYGVKRTDIHGISPTSDSLFDVAEVLNYQLCEDGVNGYTGCTYPLHWNDNMPLCRIVKNKVSTFNRNKQLPIFPSDKNK